MEMFFGERWWSKLPSLKFTDWAWPVSRVESSGQFEPKVFSQLIHELERIQVIGASDANEWEKWIGYQYQNKKILLSSWAYSFIPLMQIAKSLVMKPASMVSTQTLSKAWQKRFNGSLPSNLARCSSPRVHAKIEAIHKNDIIFIRSI